MILSSSVLYELIGPACAKFALYRSKSYTSTLEELVLAAQAPQKSSLELLMERMEEIRLQLEQESLSDEERAFNEAAEEQSAVSSSLC